MYTVSVQTEADKPDAVEIIFAGELLIDSIEGIVSETKELLGDYKYYSITATDVEDIDLSFVQFIYSLRAHLLAKRKQLKLHIRIPDTIADLFKNTGIGAVLTQ